MEQNNKQPTPQQKRFSPQLRTIIFALLAIVAVSFIIWYVSTSGKGSEISVNTFNEQLASGKVKTVEITSKTINVTYQNGERGWFYNREAENDSLTYKKVETFNATNPETPVRIVYGTNTTFSIMNLIYILLVVGTTVFLFIWITRQVKGANNKSFDFVKNRARISESVIKFSDVAGAEEEKLEVQEIVEFLKNPRKFTEIGARIPKGILLVGPPGTGKTLLAKAIAGEASVPFFSISGSDFMELFVGVGASRVRNLFEQANKVKPCIVFIDEIDAVGRQRGAGVGGGNDEREQTLNQLLVQMDGFEPNDGIIVLAATNRADILDPALMRPGRFDRQVYIHVPDVRGREEILKLHAKKKKVADDVDFKSVARITSGFTGADIENLLNEAAILAARAGRDKVTQKDVTEGIDKVILGPQKKSWIITEADKKLTAYHEAGHAVVRHFVKNSEPVHEVSIIPRGMAAGYTYSRPNDDSFHVTKSKLVDEISMLLGGRTAEEMFLHDISTGASKDIERATELARNMVTKYGMSEKVGLVNCANSEEVFFGRDYQTKTSYGEAQADMIDQEIKNIIERSKVETTALLKKHKKVVETLVEVLMNKETLYFDELELIFAGKSAKEAIKFVEAKIAKSKKENEKQPEMKQTNVEKEKTIEPSVVSLEPMESIATKEEILKEKEKNVATKKVSAQKTSSSPKKAAPKTSAKKSVAPKSATSKAKATSKKSEKEKSE